MMPRPDLEESIRRRRYHLLFSVRRSVRYHSYRHHFYIGLQSASSFVILLLGSASVFKIFDDPPSEGWFATAAPAAITVLAALALVYRLPAKASLHNDLYRRFVDLERAFLHQEQWSDSVLDSLEDQRLQIEKDEPATYQALSRLCHNELVKSEGRPEHMKKLQWYQRLLRDVWRFDDLPVDSAKTA